MVTIYDIAKKANCSAMTVSKVINNAGKISETTRQRIQQIMVEMNYVPNSNARSLVLQQTKLLSLLIADITNPFYTTLTRGAEDAAKRLGYQLLFSNSDESIMKEKEYIETVLSARVAGVMITPVGDPSITHLKLLEQYRIPFVLIDREVPGVNADAVLGDSKEGASKLTEHLLKLGHHRIAMINGHLETSTARYRLEGYKETLLLNGIQWDEQLIMEMGFNQANADEYMGKLLSLKQPPTAIFAANNLIALAAIRSLRLKGYRVPEDMSIVCFDDLEADYVLDPFLTVASQPAYDFGAIGIQTLIERIQGNREQTRHIILPSKLILRGSSAVRN
ncbi:MAG: LacI family DNA-binding transcriptional regulator [Paenibacillaceae bacterium]